MVLLMISILFVFGAICASFVGVVVARLNTGQSFIKGRSRCDACDAPLASHSLVPIFSYFGARGRAKCCGARFSFIAPLSEVLLGSLFVLAYLSLGLVDALPFFLLSLALILALVLYDLQHQILPPSLLYPFILLSALASFLHVSSFGDFEQTLLVALLIGASLVAIHFFSRGRAMGLADAPFAFGLALLVGAPFALAGFVFSFWIGAVIGLALLAGRPHGFRMSSEVPFAPFLAAGFLLAYYTQWNPFFIIVASLPSK